LIKKSFTEEQSCLYFEQVTSAKKRDLFISSLKSKGKSIPVNSSKHIINKNNLNTGRVYGKI